MSNLDKLRNIRSVNSKYGWKPSDKSTKYISNTLIIPKAVILKKSVDLRTKAPLILDQGNLGSCTGTAISYMFQFVELKQRNKYVIKPSVLFLYYNERVMINTVTYDSGAIISDGIKSTRLTGLCDTIRWPYIISRFKIKPPTVAYTQARLMKTLSATQLTQSLNTLKQMLSSGFPFVFGFVVYESFEYDTTTLTGKVPMPDTTNEQILGGHAVCCIGYDDNMTTLENEKGMFICANSWGVNWGDRGYFYMPYKYVTDTDLCDDFWSITSVSNPNNNPKLTSRAEIVKHNKALINRKKMGAI